MSTKVFQEITCDGCGLKTAHTPYLYAGAYRHELMKGGWRCAQPGSKDFCPACVAKARAERELKAKAKRALPKPPPAGGIFSRCHQPNGATNEKDQLP